MTHATITPRTLYVARHATEDNTCPRQARYYTSDRQMFRYMHLHLRGAGFKPGQYEVRATWCESERAYALRQNWDDARKVGFLYKMV